MLQRILISMVAVALFLISIAGSFWYVFKPESVREYCKKHPEFDVRGNMKKASNIEIRVMGILLFLFSCLIETGLIVFITDATNWR